MTLADRFLEAILRHPEDDTPRLVYADWLEEQDDQASAARAEFIRGQCRLAALKAGRSSERARIEQRVYDLLGQYHSAWAGPLRDYVVRWTFHRGFIDQVFLRAQTFVEHAEDIFRLAPIQHIRLLSFRPLFQEGPSMPALADCPCLARLVSLGITEANLRSEDLQALAASEYLTSLDHLNLANNHIGRPGIRALVRAPVFARLTTLNLQGNNLNGESATILASTLLELASRGELIMKSLDVRGNAFSRQGRYALTSPPVLRRIVRL